MTTYAKTFFLLSAAIVAGGLFYLLLVHREATTVENMGPIKIGFIAPLTGDAAIYGVPGKNVVALAVREINLAGGINGRPISVIYEDGKCDGQGAAAAMTKLATIDQVRIVIGGFCSSESFAAIPIAAAHNIVMLSPSSSSPDLTDISPLFARNYPSDAGQGRVLAETAATGLQFKKVAFLQEQLDYPLGIYQAFTERFLELGGQTVREEFSASDADYPSKLERLRNTQPDALFVATQAPATAEKIFAILKAMNWKVPLFVSDIVPGDPDTVRRNAATLEGALVAEFSTDPSNQRFQLLREHYLERYGGEMAYASYAQTEYDAVYLLRDALLAVGEDAERIGQWLRQVKDWPGASGLITIGANGDRAGGHVLKVIRNGNVEAVATPL